MQKAETGRNNMIVGAITLDMRYAVETLLRRIARSVWCTCCNQIVDLVTFSEAVRLAETNPATLYLWLKAGRVHCLNTGGGNLICAGSLQRGDAITEELDHRRIE